MSVSVSHRPGPHSAGVVRTYPFIASRRRLASPSERAFFCERSRKGQNSQRISPVKGSQSQRTLAHDPDALSDAQALLARYPDVSSEERDRLGRFLRKGAPIDIGLLSSNTPLWRIAERFKRDHTNYFRLGASVYAGWVAAVVGIALVLLLIKDIGVP